MYALYVCDVCGRGVHTESWFIAGWSGKNMFEARTCFEAARARMCFKLPDHLLSHFHFTPPLPACCCSTLHMFEEILAD